MAAICLPGRKEGPAMPSSASAARRVLPFATSSVSEEIVLTTEDVAAISTVLDAAKLEVTILRERIAILEREQAAGSERAGAAERQLAEAIRARNLVTEALQEREHRLWSAEARAEDCERSARISEERAIAAENRESEAKARLTRVREALGETPVQRRPA